MLPYEPDEAFGAEPISLAEALAELREKKTLKPEWFPAGATEEELGAANARLTYPIPQMWQEALKISDGFVIGNTQYHDTTQIDPVNEDEKDPQFRRAPIGSLIIGSHGSGDMVFLDAAQQTPAGNCRVIWIPHDSEDENHGDIPTFLRSQMYHETY